MDFFDKLKSSFSSPLKSFQGNLANDTCVIKTWTLPVANFAANHIRLLLYRDCDKRGRKCLYDSHHVIRDKNGKFSYVNTTGTKGCELKNLSEYIFGCVPLSSNCGSRRFHKYDGKYVWSQVFSPKPCRKGSATGSLMAQEISKPSCSGSATAPLLSSTTSNTSDEVDGSPSCKMATINSLPIIGPTLSSNFGKCFSLPSNLFESQSQSHQPQRKTLLGIGIMIETTGENRDGIGPYLQAMSGMIEECATWFSAVSTQAYCNPGTFVQTLYDFTSQFKNMVFSRLVNPIVSPISLIPNWRSLPGLTAELTQLILENDERHCKLSKRIKLVVIGGAKKIGEVAGLLYLFKILLLQCSRGTEMDVGIDATAFCNESDFAMCKNFNEIPTNDARTQGRKLGPQSYDSSCVSMSSSSAGISMSSTALSISSLSSPPSPPLPQTPTVIQQTFTITAPKLEQEKLQRRDYDSGIELELDHSSINLVSGSGPSKAMRRSVSQKFDSGCGSSSDEQSGTTPTASTATTAQSRRYSRTNLLHLQHSHEFEEVSFHLGDLTVDSGQSFNTLALSEPNLDKLKIYHGSSSYMELVESNTKIERLPTEPKEVNIDFGHHIVGKSPRPYCPYCDSVGIVSKFSPLYYIQWVKTTCCNSGLSEENYNLMKSFSSSKFIVVNLDKPLIRTVNFDPTESCRTNLLTSCNSNSSSLVNNLLHNLQQLLATDRPEAEIEHFIQVQLDFIKKIAQEFGESWMTSDTNDSALKKKYSYLSLSDNDLKLIYSLAKMKFPSLSRQTEN